MGTIYVEGTKEVLQDPQVNQRLFRKEDVDAVELILKKSGPNKALIETDDDWQTVEMILSFFSVRWPEEAKEFRQSLVDIKQTRNAKGDSTDKQMRYLAALPPRLSRLLRAVFPLQKFDKKFMYKFIRKFPAVKVGGE